jgi:hypothetical protein
LAAAHDRDERSAIPASVSSVSGFALVPFEARRASPLTRAPGGDKPMSASDSMVLPLPDSPTRPSDSPGGMPSETPFTGFTEPAAVGNSTVSSRSCNTSPARESYPERYTFSKICRRML